MSIENSDRVGLPPEIHSVAKLSTATCGINPRTVLSLSEVGQDRMLLCQIVGEVIGVKMKEGPDGTTHYPLVGRFLAQAMKDGRQIITRSGVLYLPSGIHEEYETRARELDGTVLNIALELYVVKAGNKSGYSYESIDLMPPAVADPLLAMSEKLRQNRAYGPLGTAAAVSGADSSSLK